MGSQSNYDKEIITVDSSANTADVIFRASHILITLPMKFSEIDVDFKDQSRKKGTILVCLVKWRVDCTGNMQMGRVYHAKRDEARTAS